MPTNSLGLLYKPQQSSYTQGMDNMYNATKKSPFMTFMSKYSKKNPFDTSFASTDKIATMSPMQFNNNLQQINKDSFSMSSEGMSDLGKFTLNKSASEGETNIESEVTKTTEDAVKSEKGGGFKASAGTNAIVGAAGMAAGMISGKMEKDAGIQADNIDQEVNQGKMAGAGALSGAASGAAMGAQFGPWGAVIGGVVGGAAGFFSGKSKAKKMENERQRLVKKRNIGRMHEKQAKLSEESNMLASAAQARYAKKGTKFSMLYANFKLSHVEGPIKKREHKKVQAFKIGGKLNDSNNIIPNGVSHEEENVWGTKGQPVVKCKKDSCTKIYEIESDELIITKETTKMLEKLVKENDTKKLGKYMTEQILGNTYSYTNTYKNLNNEGI